MKRQWKPCCFLLLVTLMSLQTAFAQGSTAGSQYLALPFVARVAGVGGFYGIGALARDIGGTSMDVAAAKAIGDGNLNAEAVALLEIPIFLENFTLSLGGGNVRNVLFEFTYGRGFEDTDVIISQRTGNGFGGILTLSFFEKSLQFSGGIAQLDSSFGKFFDTAGREIELPNIELEDLKTHYNLFGISLDFTNDLNQPTEGIKFKVNLQDFQNNTALSETLTTSTQVTAYLPLNQDITWVWHAFTSDASVTTKKMTDRDRVRDILSIECDMASIPVKQEQCEEFEEDLTNNIVAHNENGTAQPLGGNSRLRSFREARFRAAHARFLGTELQWNFPFFGELLFQWAVFAGIGNVSDKETSLFKEDRSSYGSGFRILSDELTVRLDGGTGQEGFQWHLVLGNPW